MIHKHFRFRIITQVTLIGTLCVVTAFILVRNPTLFLPLTLGIIILALVINLIRYIEKSTRDLTHFLLSIRQGAYTEMYTSGHRGKPYAEFSSALNEVVKEFAALNEEKELHYQYLQALNENIGVAILSFGSDGKLMMMNRAAKDLLKMSSFASINSFREIDESLYLVVTQLKADDRKVVQCIIREEILQLNVQSKEIVLQGKRVKIILLQNLNRELEENEIDAWHQLMRVLTHEIMNSVTPIASLAGAAKKILSDENGDMKPISSISNENEEDVFSSLNTIELRSNALVKFVRTYKEYAKPLKLNLANVDLLKVVQQVVTLLKPVLDSDRIQLMLSATHQQIVIKADEVLIEQVIINLIKNSMEAFDEGVQGKIFIEVLKRDTERVRIIVKDNGRGIDPELLPKVFVPFFTTKSRGSGIGLSLTRQIINLHNGSIKVKSTPGTGTTFTIDL